MTGLDFLREELKKRGFNDSQIRSKILPAVLDIVTNSGDKYTKMRKSEDEATEQVLSMRRKMSDYQAEIYKAKLKLDRIRAELAVAEKHREHCEDYIDKFNKSLQECETEEGRDIMRSAQMYVNSVNIDTKYDNTAYIIGLASILSHGGINAIDELCKINKKICNPCNKEENPLDKYREAVFRRRMTDD